MYWDALMRYVVHFANYEGSEGFMHVEAGLKIRSIRCVQGYSRRITRNVGSCCVLLQ